MKIKIRQGTNIGYAEVEEYGCFDAQYERSKSRRGRVQGNYGDISPAITAQGADRIMVYLGVK